jgi:hypothetical protein
MAHCYESRRVRRELDKRLAETGAATGRDLVWTPQELVVLSLIQATIDRKVEMTRDYAAAVDAKMRLKFSAELRLVEAQLARLVKQIKTDVPQPMSRRSQKAQQAAFKRWGSDSNAG